jgi:hypothetical protein
MSLFFSCILVCLSIPGAVYNDFEDYVFSITLSGRKKAKVKYFLAGAARGLMRLILQDLIENDRPAATEALSDSMLPRRGMRTSMSHFSAVSRRMPLSLGADDDDRGAQLASLSSALSPAVEAPIVQNPASLALSRNCATFETLSMSI